MLKSTGCCSPPKVNCPKCKFRETRLWNFTRKQGTWMDYMWACWSSLVKEKWAECSIKPHQGRAELQENDWSSVGPLSQALAKLITSSEDSKVSPIPRISEKGYRTWREKSDSLSTLGKLGSVQREMIACQCKLKELSFHYCLYERQDPFVLHAIHSCDFEYFYPVQRTLTLSFVRQSTQLDRNVGFFLFLFFFFSAHLHRLLLPCLHPLSHL